jgi:hypothetical protein
MTYGQASPRADAKAALRSLPDAKLDRVSTVFSAMPSRSATSLSGAAGAPAPGRCDQLSSLLFQNFVPATAPPACSPFLVSV